MKSPAEAGVTNGDKFYVAMRSNVAHICADAHAPPMIPLAIPTTAMSGDPPMVSSGLELASTGSTFALLLGVRAVECLAELLNGQGGFEFKASAFSYFL